MISFRWFLLILIFGFSCTNKEHENDRGDLSPNDSLKLLNNAVANGSNKAGAYYERACYFLERGNYQSALEDVKNSIAIDSLSASTFVTLSDICFAIDKTRDSKAALEKAIALDPKNTDALLKLGELYFIIKKYQESLNLINSALKANQYLAKAYFLKGLIYKDLNDTTKAISSLTTAIEQNGNYYDAYVSLGLLYAEKKDRLAIDYFNNALRIKPNSEEVLYAKAKFYQDTEEWDNAIQEYSILIEKSPNNKFAYYNLGVTLGLGKKEYEKSMHNFEQAIKIDSTYFQAHFGKGTCLELLGDKENALESYEKALKINPDYIPAKTSILSIK